MPTLEQARQADRRRGSALLDEWQTFQGPALHRLRVAAEDMVSAMEDYRATQMWANDLTQHDAYAVDHIGGIIDHLRDALRAARSRLDETGIDPALATLDLIELEQAHARLKERYEARRN